MTRQSEVTDEQILEAAERLFTTPPADDRREVTEADVERAAYALFGGEQAVPGDLREDRR